MFHVGRLATDHLRSLGFSCSLKSQLKCQDPLATSHVVLSLFGCATQLFSVRLRNIARRHCFFIPKRHKSLALPEFGGHRFFSLTTRFLHRPWTTLDWITLRHLNFQHLPNYLDWFTPTTAHLLILLPCLIELPARSIKTWLPSVP